jgi:predicted RNA methylase
MGGYANLSEIDISFSRRFMVGLSRMMPKLLYDEVLDCGAGIGRISKELLSGLFKSVILY